MSEVFSVWNGLKQGDALLPLLFNFALECAIRRVQINQNALKLNGTHQLLVYADNVNMLGGSVRTLKKHRETFLVGSKEIGSKGNADKTKYMVTSRDQNAGRNHNISFLRKDGRVQIFGNKLKKIKILFRKKLRAD